MARTQAHLSSELQAIVPTADTATAALRFAQAYGEYMKTATANAVPTVAAFIDATCVPAMAGAIQFVHTDTAALCAGKIVTGLVAFWQAAVNAPAAFITGATLIVPPTFAALAAALTTSFGTIVDNGHSLEAAADLLATDIHTATNITPTATLAGFPYPIL